MPAFVITLCYNDMLDCFTCIFDIDNLLLFPKNYKILWWLPRDLHNLNAERSANLRRLDSSDYFHRNRSPQSIRRRFSAIHNFCINKQLRFSSFLRVPELANLFVSFSGKYSTRCIFHDSDETVDTLTFIDSHPAITEICNFRSSPKTWNFPAAEKNSHLSTRRCFHLLPELELPLLIFS
jgi:hypothetical protein